MTGVDLLRLLIELSETRGTGAVHVDGRPGGVIHLVNGRIVRVDTTACPSVGERLVRSGRLSAAAWQAACSGGRGAHRAARALVRDGHLGAYELVRRISTANRDGTHELLQSDGARVRFVPGDRTDAQRVRRATAPSPEDGSR
jgi:hypothetical protein